jgi:hypothetical protein
MPVFNPPANLTSQSPVSSKKKEQIDIEMHDPPDGFNQISCKILKSL